MKQIMKWGALGLLILFVAVNLGITYWQNYLLPLDGDLSAVTLPGPHFNPVMHDPFGWAVLTKNAVYPASNRFFAHATMMTVWRQLPFLIQRFTDPITSLYVTSGLFTLATEVLLLFALAAYVRLGAAGSRTQWSYWVAAALLVPLFQTYGFNAQMGITSRAVTYTSFYALPMALLLLAMWPIYRAANQQHRHLTPLQIMLLVLLMVVIAFNGPIAVAAFCVVLAGIGTNWLWQQWQKSPRRLTLVPTDTSWLSGQILLLLAIQVLLSMYSLYIGRNNAENDYTHTLGQLYEIMLEGIKVQMGWDWGLPLLMLVVALNALLVRFLTSPTPERRRVLQLMGWVVALSLLYVALIPFGGYRPYRPLLIRNDSILPVTLGIVLAYGVSAHFLLFRLRKWAFGGYLTLVALLTCTFVYANYTMDVPPDNGCEQWALDQMAHSDEATVRVSDQCAVISWVIIHEPAGSEFQAAMLHYWGVTKRVQPYYQ